MQKQRFCKAIYLIALSLWLVFIFSNSLRPGDASNAQSAFVTGSLNDLLALFGSFLLTGAFVRMLAHFGEFFILGLLVYLSIPIFKRNSKLYLSISSVIGVGVAILDETIQYFVPGRSMSLADIFLDAIGSLFGFWGTLLLFLFWKKKRKSKVTDHS